MICARHFCEIAELVEGGGGEVSDEEEESENLNFDERRLAVECFCGHRDSLNTEH